MKSGLVVFFFGKSNVVVVSMEIELGEPGCPMQLTQQLFDDRNSEFADTSHGIEMPIIDAEMPGSVLLFDQNDGGGETGLAVLYHSRFQQLLDLLLYL